MAGQTSEDILEKVNHALSRVGVDGGVVHSVATDGASNEVKAHSSQFSSAQKIWCVCHILNLVVMDGIRGCIFARARPREDDEGVEEGEEEEEREKQQEIEGLFGFISHLGVHVPGDLDCMQILDCHLFEKAVIEVSFSFFNKELG